MDKRTIHVRSGYVKMLRYAPYFLAVLLVLGAFLRFFQLGAAPYWMDEGYTVNAVLAIEAHSSTMLDSGQNYSCPLYCYPTEALARLTGNSAVTFRAEAALAGIIFIAVFFFVARGMFGEGAALLATLFAAFSYFQIAWSRQARWYTLFEVFFWLALFFFYKALHARDWRQILLYAVAAVAATALACLSHGLGYLLPLIFLAWFLIDALWVRRNLSRRHILAVCIAGICIAIVVAIFDRGIVIGELRNFSLHYELPRYVLFYVRSYWVLLLLGAAYMLFKDRPYKNEMGFLLFVFAAYLFALSFLTGTVQYRYLFMLTPVFFIIGALGILEIAKLVKYPPLQWAIIAAALALFFVSGEGVLLPQTQYFLESDPPSQSGYEVYVPQPDWNAAYAAIAADLAPDDIVVSSMPQFNNVFLHEPGYWIEYDYYIGVPNAANIVQNGREYYADAAVIPDLPTLQQLMSTQHGFIVFDYYATDQRISPDIIAYIKARAQQVFYEYTNPYSQVWVYRF